ncbi:hypothetical protein BpHYR1_033352 [Brachionus plicatilis]|uniref:Uncharacterized protein n=1 Tax=Brachionus plicatilis TaxID=10195 RepID=A0A3M7PWD1_BRAPC|nr:hypothetical protein BpHYR1_033352 [Brachionus plicatilis]
MNKVTEKFFFMKISPKGVKSRDPIGVVPQMINPNLIYSLQFLNRDFLTINDPLHTWIDQPSCIRNFSKADDLYDFSAICYRPTQKNQGCQYEQQITKTSSYTQRVNPGSSKISWYSILKIDKYDVVKIILERYLCRTIWTFRIDKKGFTEVGRIVSDYIDFYQHFPIRLGYRMIFVDKH